MAKKNEEDKQFELGLKEPWTNKFWKQRQNASKRFQRFENYRFIKQSAIWFLITLVILMNALIFDYYRYIESILPNRVPFLNNYIQLSPRLINMEQLFFLPVASIAVTVLLVIIAIRIFNRSPYYSFLALMILSVALTGVLLNLVNLTNQYI